MSRQPVIHGYRDLTVHLRHAILEGQYPPGDRLPGEKEFATRFHLNRHTVRAAFAELEQEGLIYRVQGKGTFVAIQKIPYAISPGTSFSTTLEKLGLQGTPDLLSMEKISAPSEIARYLAIQPNESIWQLEILRRIESFPVCLTTSWLPASRFPELDTRFDPFRSLYRVLREDEGVSDIRRSWSRIEARLPNPWERDLLSSPPHLPLLVTRSLAKDAQEVPVELSLSRARSDAYTLEVNFPS